MSIHKVALVGANGTLGPYILSALQASSNHHFDITILTRATSKSTYPPTVTIKPIQDMSSATELTAALTNHDALIIAFASSNTTQSITLINAAHAAGVTHIIPSDFGSADSQNSHSLAIIPDYKGKVVVRKHLQSLIQQSPSTKQFSWTSIVCGHFLDFGLKHSLFGIDLSNHKARIFDGGNIKFSATMLSTVGLAVARILSLVGTPDESRIRNKVIYIQSLSTTQKELLSTVQKITGTHFDIENISDSERYLRETKEKLFRGDGSMDMDVDEELVAVEGIVNSFWEEKEEFANELLGLPVEQLEGLVREILQ